MVLVPKSRLDSRRVVVSRIFDCNRNDWLVRGSPPKEGQENHYALYETFPFSGLAGALLCSTALVCSPALPAQGVAPKIRIVNRIDESQLVTLKGNTHPAANAKNDRGRVSPDLPMTDLILVLSREPGAAGGLREVCRQPVRLRTRPTSTTGSRRQQVGENFGPSETDIATISNWLTGHGFRWMRCRTTTCRSASAATACAGGEHLSHRDSQPGGEERRAHRQYERPADSRRAGAGGGGRQGAAQLLPAAVAPHGQPGYAGRRDGKVEAGR